MKNFTIENETNNITVSRFGEGSRSRPQLRTIQQRSRAGEAGGGLARSPAGRDLEQPAGRNAGQEVQGSRDGRIADLESDSEPRRDCPGCRREAALVPEQAPVAELPETAQPEAGIPEAPEPAVATPVAPQSPDVAPEAAPAKKKATRAKKAPVAATREDALVRRARAARPAR